MSANNAAISGFKDGFLGLTLGQRRCLKPMVRRETANLVGSVRGSWVDVGLVSWSGGKFVATGAGRRHIVLLSSTLHKA